MSANKLSIQKPFSFTSYPKFLQFLSDNPPIATILENPIALSHIGIPNETNFWKWRDLLRIMLSSRSAHAFLPTSQQITNDPICVRHNSERIIFNPLPFNHGNNKHSIINNAVFYKYIPHIRTTETHCYTDTIFFTRNDSAGFKDAASPISITRFLARYAKIPERQIEQLTAIFNSIYSAPKLEFARTPEEIVNIYKLGPRSCMDGRKTWNYGNPVSLYGLNVKLAIAYFQEHGTVQARAICNLERKTYGRVYGRASLLKTLLEAEKFIEDVDETYNDIDLPLVFVDNELNKIVFPYLDYQGVGILDYRTNPFAVTLKRNTPTDINSKWIVNTKSTAGFTHLHANHKHIIEQLKVTHDFDPLSGSKQARIIDCPVCEQKHTYTRPGFPYKIPVKDGCDNQINLDDCITLTSNCFTVQPGLILLEEHPENKELGFLIHNTYKDHIVQVIYNRNDNSSHFEPSPYLWNLYKLYNPIFRSLNTTAWPTTEYITHDAHNITADNINFIRAKRHDQNHTRALVINNNIFINTHSSNSPSRTLPELNVDILKELFNIDSLPSEDPITLYPKLRKRFCKHWDLPSFKNFKDTRKPFEYLDTIYDYENELITRQHYFERFIGRSYNPRLRDLLHRANLDDNLHPLWITSPEVNIHWI